MANKKKTELIEGSKIVNDAEVQELTSHQKKMLSMNEVFRNMEKYEQDAIINFFNLHNCAIWIYNNLSEVARVYIEDSISMSNELNKSE